MVGIPCLSRVNGVLKNLHHGNSFPTLPWSWRQFQVCKTARVFLWIVYPNALHYTVKGQSSKLNFLNGYHFLVKKLPTSLFQFASHKSMRYCMSLVMVSIEHGDVVDDNYIGRKGFLRDMEIFQWWCTTTHACFRSTSSSSYTLPFTIEMRQLPSHDINCKTILCLYDMINVW